MEDGRDTNATPIAPRAPTAPPLHAMFDGLIAQIACARTIRLVSTANLRRAVLLDLVPQQDLDALAEIEGATSMRLTAEARGVAFLPAEELVYNVPHARFINASFAYARPRAPNRFNGPDRGAWYAALDVATCHAEVGYHLTQFLRDAGDYHATVDYVELLASLAGAYVDLRRRPDDPSLAADPAQGYPAGNALAAQARAEGLNGIIYPAVRHSGGTCLAALWPHAVQSVTQGDLWRLTWNGTPVPVVTHG